MAFTLNDGFLVLYAILFAALAISNFVEMKNKQDQTQGRRFFALIFMMFALGLGAYKITTR